MKYLIGLLLALGFITITAFMTFQKKKRVIFFGDSITQAGVQPGGYITHLNDILSKEGATEKFELVGSGIGGNKVYDLYLRLEEDVLSKQPDIVVIYIGVNDVWHKRTHGTGTDLDKFEKFYNALIKKIQTQGARIILCTPAVIGERTDSSNELDGDLNQYSNTIRKIARSNNLPLVDLRQGFIEYNKKNNPENKESGILTSDRVHLNDVGNQFVAEEMWKVLKML